MGFLYLSLALVACELLALAMFARPPKPIFFATVPEPPAFEMQQQAC